MRKIASLLHSEGSQRTIILEYFQKASNKIDCTLPQFKYPITGASDRGYSELEKSSRNNSENGGCR